MTTSTPKSHMPKNSVWFEKVIPTLLIALGIFMLALMLFAAGVALGLVRF